jgi:hypothetical protein
LTDRRARATARVRAVVSGALVIVVAAACATTGGRAASREFVGGTALAPGDAITALPDSGTYAWVDPSESILHATVVDDRRSEDPGMPGLREDVAIVLRSRGWRESSPDEADYRLTIARIHRPDPAQNPARNSGILPNAAMPRCTGAVGERREMNCTTRPDDVRSGDAMTIDRYGSWVVLVMRRRDGALFSSKRTLVWDQQPADVDFAEPVFLLLRAARP